MSVCLHYINFPSAYMGGSENILVTVVKKDQKHSTSREITQNIILFSVRLPIDKDHNFI
jgi:hypothetical protein